MVSSKTVDESIGSSLLKVAPTVSHKKLFNVIGVSIYDEAVHPQEKPKQRYFELELKVPEKRPLKQLQITIFWSFFTPFNIRRNLNICIRGDATFPLELAQDSNRK